MDILSIGEILIDLAQTGVNAKGVPLYAANPGGAPANLSVAASRLGARTAFIGKVGNDAFGRYLTDVLKKDGVDVSALAVDAMHPTSLAVVSVDANGERSFTFYRRSHADTMLMEEEIQDFLLRKAHMVHFGSVSLTAEPARGSVLSAIRRARSYGAVITYDPNYRARLWDDPREAIIVMRQPLPLVDILKVSEEELPLLSGSEDWEEGSRRLMEKGISLILVTLGEAGCFYRLGHLTGRVHGFPAKVVDTNGAGDTFFGASLSKLCREDLSRLSQERLEDILTFANRAASLSTTRAGAIPSMPRLEELE